VTKILVLANETIGGRSLIEKVQERHGPDVEFFVVVPRARPRRGNVVYDEAVRDITAFLTYAGEPAALKRTSMGVWVLLYLAFFTFLAWLLKHEFWKDVH